MAGSSKLMVYGSATKHLYMSPGGKRANVFQSRLGTFGTRWLSIVDKSHCKNRFVTPILWYPGAVPNSASRIGATGGVMFSCICSVGTEFVKRAIVYQISRMEGRVGVVR